MRKMINKINKAARKNSGQSINNEKKVKPIESMTEINQFGGIGQFSYPSSIFPIS